MATSTHKHDDVLTPPQLVAVYARIDIGRCYHEDARRRSADPISMAVHSAICVGWKFINPTSIDIGGVSISILKISPAGLKSMYREHYQRRTDAIATQQLMDKITEATGLSPPPNAPTLGWQVVRALYKRFTMRKLRDKARMLLRVVSGAVITGAHMLKHKA